MQDYMRQLVLRTRQPELEVRPRLLSRFESPQSLTVGTFTSSIEDEELAVGLQSEIPAPTGASIEVPAQQLTGSQAKGPETTDSLPQASPGKASFQPNTGRTGELPNDLANPARAGVVRHREDNLPQGVPDVSSPVQDDEITSSSVQQTPLSIRVERPIEPAGPSVNLRGRRALDKPDRLRIQNEGEPLHALSQTGDATKKRKSSFSSAMRPKKLDVGRRPTEIEPSFYPSPALEPNGDRAQMPGREIFRPISESGAPLRRGEQLSDAPTIQVTIGRVEIRATISPPQPRKAPTQPRAMSLDEYLKQRNGSRR